MRFVTHGFPTGAFGNDNIIQDLVLDTIETEFLMQVRSQTLSAEAD
jgi:hypothetical protein